MPGQLQPRAAPATTKPDELARRPPLEDCPMKISNDQELKQALDRLSPAQQRQLGGLFVQHALSLCDEPKIHRALRLATDPEASEADLDDAFHSAKAWAVQTYAECGRDTDWGKQAAHFLASATACLANPHPSADEGNPAWKAAMQVRMARSCALITGEAGEDYDDEVQSQHRIATEFLNP
jgi:hypothetical protein